MFPYGGDYDACTLLPCFLGKYAGDDLRILVVQMADGFIQYNEIVRLAKRADKSYPLLLTKGKFLGFHPCFIGNPQCFEQVANFFFVFVSGKAVL